MMWLLRAVQWVRNPPSGAQVRVVVAIVAAVTTEALFWTVAALLGVSVVEARKRIWRKITGRAG